MMAMRMISVRMFMRLLAAVLAPAAAFVILASDAAAQTGGPPQPNLTQSPHPAWGYGVMFILLLAVIGVSIMPSRRGHRD